MKDDRKLKQCYYIGNIIYKNKDFLNFDSFKIKYLEYNDINVYDYIIVLRALKFLCKEDKNLSNYNNCLNLIREHKIKILNIKIKII